jgi:hypothetical protein
MNNRLTATTLTVFAAFGALAPGADAQWTVTSLHPAGATESQALAASGGQQAGYAMVGGRHLTAGAVLIQSSAGHLERCDEHLCRRVG